MCYSFGVEIETVNQVRAFLLVSTLAFSATLASEQTKGAAPMKSEDEPSSEERTGAVPGKFLNMPSIVVREEPYTKETARPPEPFQFKPPTGEPIGEELFARMLAARNFQSGLQMLRQVEFSLFDFLLHINYDPERGKTVQALLDDVRREVAVVTYPAFNRFQHAFSHVFAGGYAAGYYSYKWAEVLAADAFAKFKQACKWPDVLARGLNRLGRRTATSLDRRKSEKDLSVADREVGIGRVDTWCNNFDVHPLAIFQVFGQGVLPFEIAARDIT